MINNTIDTLNDVTKMLIDSQKGYEKSADIVSDKVFYKTEFERRAKQRGNLVLEFQAEVQRLGGDFETKGGVVGAMHRAGTDISSLFQDNEKAALEAIDDGEEKLFDTIKSKIKDDELTPSAIQLLNKAMLSAREGEAFADRWSENA
ncbi:PA2169 family four-helix-bundle protein [Hirschia baltica]|uniref:DUF2383 domain-containing protein n=1 Tax=Hirschia baltica (strain ATCC 49814 / DSM 5838 / IFAM 1418) TaxID=582402 RepID=C6XLB0_HIRBI|nr:PA2169 family four-helix-bundle protein [Hirschia baltica]ACT59709.1 hypothetical protein Hbal_2026 [Hirschia baltica ATCC 49814]